MASADLASDSLEVLAQGDYGKISEMISDAMEGMDAPCGRFEPRKKKMTLCISLALVSMLLHA
jgi:hypothetical protein